MKKLLSEFRKFRSSKGFTLIELLVVIGILGILAAALVATIDPFEQLKKGQDANAKNTAVEYLDANIRYYTTHNALPWADTSVTGCNSGASPTAANLNAGSMTGCITSLISDGELKTGFTNVTGILTTIYVTGSSNSVTVCYAPQSKSGDRDPGTKYDANGQLTNGCISQSATNTTGTNCYWCTQ